MARARERLLWSTVIGALQPLLVLGDFSRPAAERLSEAGASACLATRALTPFQLQRAMQHALLPRPAKVSASAAAPSLLATSASFGTPGR